MATDELMARALQNLSEHDEQMSVDAIHNLIDIDNFGDTPLSIAEVARVLDISAHTLRYYENLGLVQVSRDLHGYRSYDAEAMRRLLFLTRMRLSGMSMRDLQLYIKLVDQGESTVSERLDMLVKHRDGIRHQIRQLSLSLAATEFKIATYGGHAGD